MVPSPSSSCGLGFNSFEKSLLRGKAYERDGREIRNPWQVLCLPFTELRLKISKSGTEMWATRNFMLTWEAFLYARSPRRACSWAQLLDLKWGLERPKNDVDDPVLGLRVSRLPSRVQSNSRCKLERCNSKFFHGWTLEMKSMVGMVNLWECWSPWKTHDSSVWIIGLWKSVSNKYKWSE